MQSSVLGFKVSKQDTNGNAVSVCLLTTHTLAQGPACVPQRGALEDELGLEFHPEKLRRWREKRMLSGLSLLVFPLDTGDKFGLILSN